MNRAAPKPDDLITDLFASMKLFAAFDDATGLPVEGLTPDAREVVAQSPYRSIFSLCWPPAITDLWSVGEDCGAPPAAMLEELAATIQAGRAVLLVSRDRATRDRCKKILEAWVNARQVGAH